MKTFQEMEDIRNEKGVTVFYDSSAPEFFGTKVCMSEGIVDWFYVVAKQHTQKINMAGGPTREVAYGTSISGEFAQKLYLIGHEEISVEEEMSKLLDNPRPLDVDIFAYDPINRIPYILKVGGIQVVRVTAPEHIGSSYYLECEFVAAMIMNWQRRN